MAVIVITARVPEPAARQVAAVRRATGLGLTDIRGRLVSGSPLIERELFLNEHDEVAAEIRRLLAATAQADIPTQIYELQPGEHIDTAPLDICRISEQTLEGILDRY